MISVVIMYTILLLSTIIRGDDNPGLPDSDNCVFMFKTEGAVKNDNFHGVEITINKSNGDTEKTTENFVKGWDYNWNDEDFSNDNYQITNIEFNFWGDFDLERMSIECGNEINVGTKVFSLTKSKINELTNNKIGTLRFGNKVDYIKINRAAWNCNEWDINCLRNNIQIITF